MKGAGYQALAAAVLRQAILDLRGGGDQQDRYTAREFLYGDDEDYAFMRRIWVEVANPRTNVPTEALEERLMANVGRVKLRARDQA